MGGHGGEHLQKQVQLIFSHRLDDESAVVAEKEKAAAATGPFSSLEDLVSVQVRAQALLEDLGVGQVLTKCLQKELPLMERYFYVGV